ncbi:MAG: RNA polymerase factor sigma-54 [Burkholderiaceae bacterium]
MKITLTTKTSQQLSLTPQLQQAIRLLTLSNLELRQELDDFVRDNPLLELEDVADAPVSEAEPEGANESADSREEELDSLADWKTKQAGDGDDDGREDQDQSTVSLNSHLREQAAGLQLEPKDRLWLEILIEALDEDGYLRDDLEEIAASFENVFIEHFEEPLLEEEYLVGLRLLQSLEPAGVGARSLQECLLLQLEALRQAQSVTHGSASISHEESLTASQFELSRKLIEDHIETLGNANPVSLAKTLGEDKNDLIEALRLIRSLNPRPAGVFRDQHAGYLIPDVVVYRTRGGLWRARLASGALPKLSINNDYAQLIKTTGGESSNLSQKLQEARWMLKNIQQRSETILRVSQAIVEAQQAFFEDGPKAMRPLVLRDIAEECELHESTVSRVTSQKFMLTPLGCYELKYFFGSHVSTDDGGTASATALRAQIADWIKNETPGKPLSDQAIADRFSETGVVVARRTVAKYREALRIPSAAQRRHR